MENQEILSFIKEQVVQKTRKPLTFAEESLICECWEDNKPYEELEEPFCGHTIGYIKTQTAPKLWDRLTQITGQKVTKRNFKSILEKAYEEYLKIDVIGQVLCIIITTLNTKLKPDGTVAPEGRHHCPSVSDSRYLGTRWKWDDIPC
ncbi:MAG: hypothetical protein ACYTXE_30530 [Nostoc sp.]